MTRETENTRRKVTMPRGGLLHVVDAAGYSIAGLRRLWKETAARLEVLGAVLVAVAFVIRGAEPWHWVAVGVLFALVLAIEAVNTALEDLANHLSPGWSQMAKDVKDLGSFAVGMITLATGGVVAAVLFGWV